MQIFREYGQLKSELNNPIDQNFVVSYIQQINFWNAEGSDLDFEECKNGIPEHLGNIPFISNARN